MRQRHLARRHIALFSACLESLEKRSMLHAGHDVGDEADLSVTAPQTANGDHIAASQFLEAYPQFAGKDLWAASTFNPTSSSNRNDWLYDPHAIEDDITPASQLYPAVPRAGADAGSIVYPDLIPLTGSGYLSPSIDKTEIPGHNLMRFSTAVGNMGGAPAILTSANSGTPPVGSGITSWVNADGTQNVLQQIYSYDGTSFSFSSYRPAGRMVWHSGHSHFHLEGYASYRLLTKNPDGSAGAPALRSGFDGAPAVGDKVGFCLVNINSSFTVPGTGQSSSSLPGYGRSGQPSTSCGFLQGIHVGWADVYASMYDGQWIDVTGVANGNYFLEVTLDAYNVIQESNETNNTVLVPVTLNTSNATGGTVLPDRFEPNNSATAATDLGVLGVETQSGLTAHITGESDFFTFTAASSGSYSVQLQIADRDMNLYVYNSANTLLGSSTSSASGTNSNQVTETVTTTFVAGQRYYVEARAFGSDLSPTTSAISSNYALKILVNPTLTNTVADSSASEVGLESGMFSIARNGPVSSPLVVNFTVGGTAQRGVDYQILQDGVPVTGNTLNIGNEASAANLQILPIGDSLVETNETVTITVGSGAYVIGGSNVLTLTINDTPPMAIANAFTYETAHNLSFDFSLDVSASLQASDLVLLNTTTGQTIAATTVAYNSSLNRATFGFGQILPDGNYQASIARASLTHSQGVELGADAAASFFVLAGDIDRDGNVDFDDLLIVAQNFDTTGKTFSQGNINYDAAGNVDFDDLLLVAQRFEVSLLNAVATPVKTSSTTTRTTTTKRRVATVID